ncbi:MAG TPA: phosphodiester glycosidase family protein [Candidatus Kapabacteria bacterium]|nr:phosphodiester glycosidase family protein [Candidatus Kapabacteria bacterium]
MNNSFAFWMRSLTATVLFLVSVTSQAALTVGEWVPVYKGVELSISTNEPGPEIVRRQVVYALRVDLLDPDVEFFTTPRITNYSAFREVAAYTGTEFLRRNNLQVVINANYFDNGTYYLPEGTPMALHGLEVSQGEVVSTNSSAAYAATITFDQTNAPTFIRSNWPPVSNEGIYTAVAGNATVVAGGTNVGTRFDVDPRTVFGLSEDRRYLFLVAIDGRQPGYSEGATLFECGEWLLALGASDGINVDGGGSTLIVFEDSTGQPVRVNSSSAVADSGRERTVGSHFGIYAKPLPGFFNDVVAIPGTTNATISFTSTAATVSEILYGTTPDLGTSGGASATEEMAHNHVLTGLVPDTGYYFQITGLSNGVQQLSPIFFFTTTNNTSTNLVFDVTNEWKYAFTGFDDTYWTTSEFDDTNWLTGQGLLWLDSPVNPNIQPLNTQLPLNQSTGYPYITYYFRTHFNLETLNTNSSFLFRGLIDDGAVFYLNGSEFYRLRMPTNSTSTTLATGVPCTGDAECVDEFKISFSQLPSLKEGDNVIAVEVHNYNARSSDTTFGLALDRIDQVQPSNPPEPAELNISIIGTTIEISWLGAGGTLQSAADPLGPWNDLQTYPGNTVTIQPTEVHQFFRLKR